MQQHTDPPEPFPHNEEPQLRKLGLSTSMKRGVPTLDVPHTICEKGKVLTGEQAQLLKLVGIKMVTFKIGLRARWDAASGQVVQVEGLEVERGAPEEEEAEDDAGAEDEMSE